MTQLEKISAIVGLIIIGAGIFSHSLSLQGDVKILTSEQKQIKLNIDNNLKEVMRLKSYNESISNKIDDNKEWITYLQNKVDSRQNSIEASMIITHQLLKKIEKK